MQRLATTDRESDLPIAQFNVTATLTGFVFLSHNFPEPEALDAQFLDRRRRNDAPDAVDAGHDSGRAPPTVFMRQECNDLPRPTLGPTYSTRNSMSRPQ